MEIYLSRALIILGVKGEVAGKGGLLIRLRQRLSAIKDFGIGIPIVASWAVLRKETGDEGLMKDKGLMRDNIKFIWPSSVSVVEYLDSVLEDLSLDRGSSHYTDTITTLMGRKTLSDLPPTLDALRSRLTTIVQNGTDEQAITLYEVFRGYQRIPDPHFPQSTTLLDPSIKNDVLSRFLYAFTSTRFGKDAPIQPLKLELMRQEVLRELDRPWGLDVWHSLVAHRARALEDSPMLEDGSEVISMLEYQEQLAVQAESRRKSEGEGRSANGSGSGSGPWVREGGGKVDLGPTRREAALERLTGTWQLLSEEGVKRDMKLYMLMIEGYGRLGDLEGLQRIWNELVNDGECARDYRADIGDRESIPLVLGLMTCIAKAPFPTTKALNHMISACLLIAKTGPPFALQLFDQACAPNSMTPCDLITINVVLRHYARQADIPRMKQLFLLASKLDFKPDAITYTTLIQGLLRAGADEQAKMALDNMVSAGIDITERMCSMLIADLSKEGHKTGLSHAEEMLNEMKRRRFAVTVVTWTTLISGYFRGGWESNAWQAVKRMEDNGVYLNRVAYNVILREAGRARSSGGFENAEGPLIKIFRRMVREGTEPNGDTYYIVLDALSRGKKWKEAGEVVREMNRFGWKPEKGNLKKVLWQLEGRI
jgi:pentatricopeptide repeat protein